MATGGVAYRFSFASWQSRVTSQLGVHAESGPEWFRTVIHEHLSLLMSHVAWLRWSRQKGETKIQRDNGVREDVALRPFDMQSLGNRLGACRVGASKTDVLFPCSKTSMYARQHNLT
jgi:hypothetical protein